MAGSISRLVQLQYHFFISCSLLFYCTATDTPHPYVVYMGSTGSTPPRTPEHSGTSSDLELLASIIPSEDKDRVFVIQSYSHTFKGFSAMLSGEEASRLSRHPGVVSVFPDRYLPLHTTRSWDFLDVQSGLRGSKWSRLPVSSDVIIGIVDTGIWPESDSFRDTGMSAVPSRWKGVCMEGPDFNKSDCNRKLIGARFYETGEDAIRRHSTAGSSPRDTVGHGTHTASTAGGLPVPGANYYGLAKGTAKGGFPSSRLAMYKACSVAGCLSSNILKAIDDAVSDGVDVISISVGMTSFFQPDFLSDPISIGAFHANEKGILVACSAGNDGPEPFTVVNSAPWIITVAASTIDRNFESDVVLGNGVIIKGSGINLSNLTRSKTYSLVSGEDVAEKFTPAYEARNCYPGSLDQEKTAGKILVCVDSEPTVSHRVKKLVAQSSGAVGLIIVDDIEKGASMFNSGTFPFSEVSSSAGNQIFKYLNSTRNPSASIVETTDAVKLKVAPAVAIFSARGPGGLTESILKPDIMAPGVAILAASIPTIIDHGDIPVGKKPSLFAIKSGTSMASPHVAGAAAFVKSVRPQWSPSMIKSALMTTATTRNNHGKTIRSHSGVNATWHEMGSGEINPLGALNPGLVYQTSTLDYLQFLCYHGYKQKTIRSVSGVNSFACPTPSSSFFSTGSSSNLLQDFITSINYPSISIARLDTNRLGARKVISRTATNVGRTDSTYRVSVDAPEEIQVKVVPEKLIFSRMNRTASFEVSFQASSGADIGYRFGSLVWTDGVHLVRMVFAVNLI